MRLLTLTLLACAGLSACAKPDAAAKELRLRYWGDLDEIRITEELCRAFEKAHPGVTVRSERKSSEVYTDVLLQEFAAGKAPDVIFLGPDNMDPLAAAEKLAPLDAYLAKAGLKADDFYPSLYKRLSHQGKLLVLPRDIAPIAVVYYNKALFDKAGLPYPKDTWTWDDLRSAAKALTVRDAQGRATQYGFADEWNISDAWMLSAGGAVLDNDAKPTRITMGSGPSAEGVLFRWQLLQKDRVMPSSTDSRTLSGGSQALFLNGQLALFHTGIWKTPGFRKITAFDWDVVRFPTKAGAKDPRFVIAGSGYGMRKDVEDPDLAWDLIHALGGPEGQRRMAETGLTQPSLARLAASAVFLDGQKPRNKRMLLVAAERGRQNPAWLPMLEFQRTVWQPMTDPIWMDGFSGDPAVLLKAAEDEGNRRFFKP